MAKYNASDILSQYSFNALKGRYFNPESALQNFYKENYTSLAPMLRETRNRLGYSSHASLYKVFRDSIDARIDDINTASRQQFKDALISTIVKDVHRGEIIKRGYMASWSQAIGRAEKVKRGRGRPSKESLKDKSSQEWKDWVEDSGWSDSIDDYRRLEHISGNKYLYTSTTGEQFELFFSVSGSSGLVATYTKV